MYDLADFAMQMPPEERAMLTAQILRRRQQSEAMQQANAQANRFNNLAAITQMANNPGAANAAASAQKSAQAQYKPQSLGMQGFALPASGEFVSSPMYEEEQGARREEKRTILRETLGSREALAREAEEGRNERAAAQVAAQREAANQRFMLGQTMAEIRRAQAEAAKATAGEKAAKTAQGRTLAGSDVRDLSKKEGTASGFLTLAQSFKPEYAGTTFLATAENALGRYQPLGVGKGYADQSNWWQNYNNSKNEIRNALFGSALTATEQAAFDRANITEGMQADEIRRRLGQQSQAAARAYNKLKANFGRAGYNIGEFNDLSEPQQVPAPGGQPPRPGDKYLTP